MVIYTDGAAEPNPGPGGYGVILIYGDRRRELFGGFRRTTNNRMEVYAAIHGLQILKEPCDVTLYSDSKYLVQAMSDGWVERWRSNELASGKKGRHKRGFVARVVEIVPDPSRGVQMGQRTRGKC